MSAARCLFIGPFPPPVHGQSVATRNLAELLEASGFQVDRANSAGTIIQKITQTLRDRKVIATGNHDVVYLSVNANRGIYLTSVLAASARRAGRKLVLHHHSYRYIGTHDQGMAKLAKAAGDGGVHITNCPAMGRELAARYPGAGNWISLTNIGSVDPQLTVSKRPDRPVTIGHLSNLTEEKGIGRVIDAFQILKRRFNDARLEIAGPASDDFAEEQIARAQSLFGDAFTYHGPVYSDAKQLFFDAIDLFAFPSLYEVETQGIVNLEAMACGKPVIAFDQCCIGPDIGDTGGIAVAKDGDYPAALCQMATRFLADPQNVSVQARRRYEELDQEFDIERKQLIDLMAGS